MNVTKISHIAKWLYSYDNRDRSVRSQRSSAIVFVYTYDYCFASFSLDFKCTLRTVFVGI